MPPTMPSSFITSNNRAISRIALGCATFGREVDEEESFRILDYAFERGINLLDTAEAYGGGQARLYRKNSLGIEDVRETSGEMSSSEKIVGRWLRTRGVREQIVIQTKVISYASEQHVLQALDHSLERLQTNYLDIYMLHNYDAMTPLTTGMAAMDAAVRQGKTHLVGCSNLTAAQIREALDIARREGMARFEVVEAVYNLACREIEQDILPLCEAERLTVTTYSPLGAGFLTGKYSADAPFPAGTRFDVIPAHKDIYFSEKNFRIVQVLQQLAERTGMTMARLAMQWALGESRIASVIVGARSTRHIDNALESLGGLDEGLKREMEAPAPVNS